MTWLDARGPGCRDDDVTVPVDHAELSGWLSIPESPRAAVVFAHGSGSSRHSPRNRHVARTLNQAGFVTLLADLLTPGEAADRAPVFDVELLGGRLRDVSSWLRDDPNLTELPVGWFGSSTGAGAALWAAAEPDADVGAIVSRGGRPDLAGDRLGLVRAPTLLVVGSLDPVVADVNQEALGRLRCPALLTVIPGATHLFAEPGALDTVALAATTWFLHHLPDPSR